MRCARGRAAGRCRSIEVGKRSFRRLGGDQAEHLVPDRRVWESVPGLKRSGIPTAPHLIHHVGEMWTAGLASLRFATESSRRAARDHGRTRSSAPAGRRCRSSRPAAPHREQLADRDLLAARQQPGSHLATVVRHAQLSLLVEQEDQRRRMDLRDALQRMPRNPRASVRPRGCRRCLPIPASCRAALRRRRSHPGAMRPGPVTSPSSTCCSPDVAPVSPVTKTRDQPQRLRRRRRKWSRARARPIGVVAVNAPIRLHARQHAITSSRFITYPQPCRGHPCFH